MEIFMSKDQFTKVTHQSWVSRLGAAMKGVLVGLVLLVIAFPLLFWNEGRAVKRYKTLKEGAGIVISIVSDSIDTANAEKLVHVTGKANTDAILIDPIFGVSVNALKLRRVVEMYQWEEILETKTKQKLGGGTETVETYTYSKTWSGLPISSSSFQKPEGHQNPSSIPYESTQQLADKVTLEAFTLSPSLIGKINNFELLTTGDDLSLPEALKDKAKLYEEGLYIGAEPASPQVGDVRLMFMVAKPTEVSIIAKQTGSTFEPYSSRAGGSIELLQLGKHSADSMIQKAQENNRVLTWILRLAGFILMLTGLGMIFNPLSVLADVLPILGNIVGAGTGIISFLLAAVLSLTTIAIAWIFYRPLLAVILLVIAVVLIVAIKVKLRHAKTAS